jgi:hypothetical protein
MHDGGWLISIGPPCSRTNVDAFRRCELSLTNFTAEFAASSALAADPEPVPFQLRLPGQKAPKITNQIQIQISEVQKLGARPHFSAEPYF